MLVTLTLLPLAWALASNAELPDVQFMGLLSNPQDGLTYLAKMEQGYQGEWLYNLAHTPEPHNGAAIFLFYLFLGHLARLTSLPPLIIFHVVRVLAGLFMYFALYQLGAAVWTRVRSRRTFFILVGVGSGMGWLAVALDPTALDTTTNRLLPDLTIPEAFPLYAAYTNPHFPFAIGLLALIVSIYIEVFRPGKHEEPTVYNEGLFLTVASLLLAVVMPQAIIPIGVALAVYLVVRMVRERRAPLYEASWAVPLWFPAAPFAIYYLVVTQINPAFAAWNAQNVTPSPPPQYYLAGYGLLLVLALPGIARAVRRFEPDGDQLMVVWLAVNAALLYVPTNYQRRLTVGLLIPLVYFAVRGTEDYWRNLVPPRLMRPAIILAFVLLIPSNVLAMGVSLLGTVTDKEAGLDNNLLLETDYANLLIWMRVVVPQEVSERPTVVLASPDYSMFVAGWSGRRVVYGHPYETIDAEHKRQRVLDFYNGLDCDLLEGESWQDTRWRVDYVVVGPRERALGEGADAGACVEGLGAPLMTFGDVALYRIH
ncbi:MAG: hypothetical protein M5R40_04395 [Anaerolineae bacterium]|nr:hypothetical protein [Anaerolineae bacterium]